MMKISAMALKTIKNLFSRPACRMYPVKTRRAFAATRGKIQVEMDKCILCGICQKRCPGNAIKVDKPGNMWEISRYRCVTCNACVDVCPKKCLRSENEYNSAFFNKSSERFFKNA